MPNHGPFAAAIWRSDDLARWVPAEIEGEPEVILDLVSTSSGLLAIGKGSDGAAMWRSYDDGASWQFVDAPTIEGTEGREFFDIAEHDGIIVVTGETWARQYNFDMALLSSSDGGESWTQSLIDPATNDGLTAAYRVHTAADAFWVVAKRSFLAIEDPDRCYTDFVSCTNGSEAVLLRSDDGMAWNEVDITGLVPPFGKLTAVASAIETTLAFGLGDEILVWTWPSFTTPPLREPPPIPPTPDLPLVRWDATLEVGMTYRYPLNIHCGMGFLGSFNDTSWYLVEPPRGDETGVGQTSDPNWPIAQETILGHVTLIDIATIEYSIPDGGVIGVYEASPVKPPGCD